MRQISLIKFFIFCNKKIIFNIKNELWKQNLNYLLLNKLIQRKPINRLGLNGPEEVKSHGWFKNFDWDKLYNKEIAPPFIPSVIDYFILK